MELSLPNQEALDDKWSPDSDQRSKLDLQDGGQR